MKKIVLLNTDGQSPDVELSYLKKRNLHDYQLVWLDNPSQQEFLEQAKDAQGVIIVYLQADAAVFSQLTQCKVLVTQCNGVNNIDLASATQQGIFVGNVPDASVEEVAVHTLSLWLNCVRRIGQFDRATREKQWNPEQFGEIHRIHGRTYGLVSFGRISREISRLLQPFGVRVVAYDPFCPASVLEAHGVQSVPSLEALFAMCDYVSVHTPLQEQTRNLINKPLLAHCKKGMVLLSVGRGGVVEEQAVKEKIEEGIISAAGFDVLADETTLCSPLLGMEQVIVTPHAAFLSQEATVECREKAIMQIVEVLEDGKAPTYLVNKEMLHAEGNTHD